MIKSSNTIILLRHALPKIDFSVLATEWELSPEGYQMSITLSKKELFTKIDKIYSSIEKKATQTAETFAMRNGLVIKECCELNELDRGKGSNIIDNKSYLQNIQLCFENPNESINNWEKASNALIRFSQKISQIKNSNDQKTILIVSHGIVLNLYFASLLKQEQNTFQRWKQTSFCGYGIIQGEIIIKDII